MERYKYFVCYRACSRVGNGFGHCGISRNQPIRSLDDIREIEKLITSIELLGRKIMVLYWQRFEGGEGDAVQARDVQADISR